MWIARPQLFFHGTVGPTVSLGRLSQYKELALVFVSTFEPITVTPNAIMQCNGMPLFYDTASSSKLPTLNICWAKNELGRVPLMQYFVGRVETRRRPCPRCHTAEVHDLQEVMPNASQPSRD